MRGKEKLEDTEFYISVRGEERNIKNNCVNVCSPDVTSCHAAV
jgi:hypothetical protein